MSRALSLFAGFVFLLTACQDDDQPRTLAQEQDQEIQEYLLAQDPPVDFYPTDSGFYYIPISDVISPDSEDILSIFYTITTLDGEVVVPRPDEPVVLKRGVGAVYPVGLDYGLQLPKLGAGDVFKFIFPSHLAYGELGIPDKLPQNTIVVIEVEVVNTKGDDDVKLEELVQLENYIKEKEYDKDPINPPQRLADGLILYSPDPSLTAQPVIEGDTVVINFEVSTLEGVRVITDYSGEPFEFVVKDDMVIDGLYKAVQMMRLNETAFVMMSSDHAYGSSAAVLPQSLAQTLIKESIIPEYAGSVAPFTPLVFEVTIVGIKN